MHRAMALVVGLRRRRQEPRRALEDAGIRVLGPARFQPRDRVPTDEPRRAGRSGDDRRFRRADVGDRRLLARRREDGRHLRGQRRDRRRDDGELDARQRLLQRRSRLDRSIARCILVFRLHRVLEVEHDEVRAGFPRLGDGARV